VHNFEYIIYKDRLISTDRATSNNLRLTLILLLHARLVRMPYARLYAASNGLVHSLANRGTGQEN